MAFMPLVLIILEFRIFFGFVMVTQFRGDFSKPVNLSQKFAARCDEMYLICRCRRTRE